MSKKVAIVIGSDSDLGVMQKCADKLSSFGIENEIRIMSAHRTPQAACDYAKNASENGFGVIIAAAGKAGTVTKEFLREGQTGIDVGINVNSEGKLCGDVMFDDAVGTVDTITPVPGGVGSVTTSVLLRHVLDAAMRRR